MSRKFRDFFNREQPVIDREHVMQNVKLPATVYLMIGSLGVDCSRKEIFYETLWSSPPLSNDIVDFSSE